MKRKSIDEHKAQGTYRPDRHGKTAPTGELLKQVPPAPFELSKSAQKFYLEAGKVLIEQQLLKTSDVLSLANYAVEMGVYTDSMEQVNKQGAVIKLPNNFHAINPQRKAAENALKLATAIADKLGLTPASRGRIKGASAFVDAPGGKKHDPILELLKPTPHKISNN